MGYNGGMSTGSERMNQLQFSCGLLLRSLLLLSLGLGIVSCSKKNEPPPAPLAETQPVQTVDKPVLTIDSNSLSTGDLDRFIAFKYSSLSSQTDTSPQLKSRIFDAFVEHALLLKAAKESGVSVSPTETAAYLTDLRIATDSVDESVLGEETLIQKFLLSQVYRQIDVDIKECQQYYNQNRQQFKQNKQIMLHQILLKDQKRAFEIKDILDGAPSRFEEFALAESQAVDAKNNGVMGFFEKGQLPEEIEKYVFALKKNEVSQVVQSPYGYHIFRVSQIREGRDLYFDSVKDEIKNRLLSDKLHQAYDTFLAGLKKNYQIIAHYENLPFKYESNQNGGNHDTVQ